MQDSERSKRLLELGRGLAIWQVHTDDLREQDKNARVMALDKFERLSANIEKDQRLESLPYANLWKNPAGNREFLIISGHHRVRAARKAKVNPLYVLVDESELSAAQIKSKQLAHNALNGHDDAQLLKEIYEAIDDVEERIASGVTDQDLKFDFGTIKIDEVVVDLSYETIQILFLPAQFERFEAALKLIGEDAHVLLADKSDWDGFKQIARQTGKTHDVRNVAAIVSKMVDIIHDHFLGPQDEETEWVSLRSVLGRDSIPASVADVIKRGIDKMIAEGNIGEKNHWQILEFLAADYVSAAD